MCLGDGKRVKIAVGTSFYAKVIHETVGKHTIFFNLKNVFEQKSLNEQKQKQ